MAFSLGFDNHLPINLQDDHKPSSQKKMNIIKNTYSENEEMLLLLDQLSCDKLNQVHQHISQKSSKKSWHTLFLSTIEKTTTFS